jgi:flagellar basal body L-ring protein FlgH
MGTKSIVLLLIVTAIAVALVLSVFYEPPGIDSVYITSSKETSFQEIPQSNMVFSKNESDLFLKIKTNNLTQDDVITVLIQTDDNDLFQENTIVLKNNGSAVIAIPVLKINDQLAPNSYHVEIFLNDTRSHALSFRID